MSASGIFAKRIKEKDPRISEALDNIPLKEQITRSDYQKFAKIYSAIFGENHIGTATRLLTMKRPDVFYCLTSVNQRKFCGDFGVVRSHINLNTYWDVIIERIQDSDWWQNPQPKNKREDEIKNYRAAFLDSIYYEES